MGRRGGFEVRRNEIRKVKVRWSMGNGKVSIGYEEVFGEVLNGYRVEVCREGEG